MLGFLLCTPIFALALLSFNLAMDTELDETDEVPVEKTWSCPSDWTAYQSDTMLSCISMSSEKYIYYKAKSVCQNLGGFLVTLADIDKRNFVTEFVITASVGSVWTGLYRGDGSNEVFKWEGRTSVIATGLDYIQSDATHFSSHERCGYISAYDKKLKISSSCMGSDNSLCEKEVLCTPGYYGHMCERKCHCLRELCQQEPKVGPKSVVCKYGCQTNWSGVACDIEKKVPEVSYYCINAATGNEKFVYIGIYTIGVQYRSIYGMTSNKVRGKWCNSTTTERYNSTLTTIRIPVNNITVAQMSSGDCVGQQVGQDTFSWSIVMKEYDGYIQEMDARYKFTCNFSVASNLIHSERFSFHREEVLVAENVLGPMSLQDDVLLQIIDGATGKSTSNAVIGTTVILEMQYAVQKGSLLQGVRPHNCVVYTQDKKHLQQLLDENGCQVSNSLVESFRIEEDNKIRTPFFKLFTFENEMFVTFRCEVDICFTTDCKVGCQKKSRTRRDTADLTGEGTHFTTRTIRVLQSIPDKGDGQAEDHQPTRLPAA